MKMNLKLRFQNKVVLSALIATVATFIYQVLGIFGVTPSISESQVIEWAGMILNLLVVLGVLTDPTTAGIVDSQQAMNYTEPKKEVES